MTPSAPASREPAYAWVMALLGFLFLGLGFGALGSISVFLKPLVAEFGWARGETSLAYTAGTVATGLGGILMGYLSDRYPGRLLLLAGSLVLAGCLLLLSRLTALWQLFALFTLMGAFGFSTLFIPPMNSVGHWFSHNKGLALGIVTAGGALGQGAIPFLARHLITLHGWRETYAMMGWGYLMVLLPLVLLSRTPPRLAAMLAGDSAAIADAAEEQSLPARVVIPWLSLAVIFCCVTMATPVVHSAALTSDKGYGPQQAAGVFLTIMIAGLFGRIAIGKIADHIGSTRAYLYSSLMQTLLVFWFIPVNSLIGLHLVAVGFGLGYSATMACIVICVRELAPVRISGVSMGIVTCMGWVGMGLGGWQGGFFFDVSGDYTVSFANAAATGFINVLLIGGLHLYVTRRLAEPPLQPARA